MSPFSALLLLLGVVTAVLAPILIGHGLASHKSGLVLLGLGVIVLAAGIVVVHVRLVGRSARDEHAP